MINFLTGFIVGVPVGIFVVFLYCLCSVAEDADRRMEKEIAEMTKEYSNVN